MIDPAIARTELMDWHDEMREREFEGRRCLAEADSPRNPYLHQDKQDEVGKLDDGTPLYQAYYPLRYGESMRRIMTWWDGSQGESVGVTAGGDLYRRAQLWFGSASAPWERFTL